MIKKKHKGIVLVLLALLNLGGIVMAGKDIVRPAVFSGSWYSNNKTELAAAISGYLAFSWHHAQKVFKSPPINLGILLTITNGTSSSITSSAITHRTGVM